MQYETLGNTDVKVSKLCLGSMTWGCQNNEQEAHEQLDMALGRGVNFIDTAEMYAVPSSADTFGATESIIGKWLMRRKNRSRVILATKVVGPCGDWMPHIRGGDTHLNRKNVLAALEGSLRRLRTDYVDLYQVHWPERKTNYFGKLGYEHDPATPAVTIEETLAALAECVAAGKARWIGLSNETPWGIHAYISAADKLGLPRPVSIQNPYSLLNRTFEVGLAEMAIQEHTGLLAYSPLGFGMLAGKYLNDSRPPDARLTLFPQFTRYMSPRSVRATEAYHQLAGDHGLSLAQMALAYVTSRAFVTSTIIGATTGTQLEQNLDSLHVTLPEEVLRGIEKIHKENPNPAP
jgi:aryl-alcohol dehydrogenase-like predicted oxidoreductase